MTPASSTPITFSVGKHAGTETEPSRLRSEGSAQHISRGSDTKLIGEVVVVRVGNGSQEWPHTI